MTSVCTGFVRHAALAAVFLGVASTSASASCSDKPAPEVKWSNCDKSRKVMSSADLSNGQLDWANLSATDLGEATLSGAYMFRANLSRTRLRDADLQGADLTKVQGLRAVFDGTMAAKANFTKAELNRASFVGATLSDTDFSKAELSRVNLANAKLDNAVFRFANLSRARFEGASLAGANLSGAYTYLMHIKGVDLSTVVGLTQPQLDIACGDSATILPEGLELPADWPCDD